MKAALLHDLPQWKASLKQRLRATVAPADLKREFTCYKNTQTIYTLTFQSRIPRIVDTLKTVDSPFFSQANKLIAQAEPTLRQRFSNAFHALFLQRWKMSLSFANSLFAPSIDGGRKRDPA